MPVEELCSLKDKTEKWVCCFQFLSFGPFSVGCLWHTHGKNPVRLYPKLQSQPIGLRKIFIDYFSFQGVQWDCRKPLSIVKRKRT